MEKQKKKNMLREQGTSMAVSYNDDFTNPRSMPSTPAHRTNISSSSSSSKEISMTFFMIIAVLFCAFLLSFALTTIIRFLLCRRNNNRTQLPTNNNTADNNHNSDMYVEGKEVMKTVAASVVVFPAEMTGESKECAICLNEFVEGDGVSVLVACKHGFHTRCIEGWLASSCSCPTCRRCCRASVPDSRYRVSAMEEPRLVS